MQHVSTRMTNDWMLISPVESVGDDVVMHKLPSSSKLNGDIELKNGKALIKCLWHEVQYKDDFFQNLQKDYFKIYVQLFFQAAAKSLNFVALRFLVVFKKKKISTTKCMLYAEIHQFM